MGVQARLMPSADLIQYLAYISLAGPAQFQAKTTIGRATTNTPTPSREVTRTPEFRVVQGFQGGRRPSLVVFFGSNSRNIQASGRADGAGWFTEDPELWTCSAKTPPTLCTFPAEPFDTRRPKERRFFPTPWSEKMTTIAQVTPLRCTISNEGPQFHCTFLAFRPTQIKSATGNNGNFDPASK
jgi:hypothetical protein